MQSLHANFSIAPPHYTYADYKTWSDEWELIEGFPYSLMPSPKQKHQDFTINFIWITKNILLGKSCQCKVYSEFDWIVNDDTVVRPDCMIVCEKFDADYLTFPPVLILEVGSVSTYLKDRNVKFRLYEMNAVKYYLLADTDKKKVESYELIDGIYQFKSDSMFQLSENCEVEINFEGMWYQ